jgi:hypothetical protein
MDFDQERVEFACVRKIVQSSAQIKEGLQSLFEFVKEHSEVYKDLDWDKVASSPL